MSLLETYRRTGADPPFGDPRRAHGVRFEGYYWRFTDAPAGRVVIVLCGVSHDAAGSWALVALAAHPEGLVRSALVPVARADPHTLGIEAGDVLRGTADALHVDLGPDARLDVALRDARPWPHRAFGGIGPAQIVPGLPQYWHPHLLGARVEGSARLGEQTVSLSGRHRLRREELGRGLHGALVVGPGPGLPGRRRLRRLRRAAGSRSGPWAARRPRSSCALEDRLLRLAPPFARMTAAVGESGWRVRGRSARHALELEGEAAGPPAVLPVPGPGPPRGRGPLAPVPGGAAARDAAAGAADGVRGGVGAGGAGAVGVGGAANGGWVGVGPKCRGEDEGRFFHSTARACGRSALSGTLRHDS